MNLSTKRKSLWASITLFNFGILVILLSSTTTLSNKNIETIVGNCGDCWCLGNCQDCIKEPGETYYVKCTTDAVIYMCDEGGGDQGETCGTPDSWLDCGTYLLCSSYGCIQCEAAGDCYGVESLIGGDGCSL